MGTRLKNNTTPIGGWIFRDSQISQHEITAWSLDGCITEVINRRQSNPRFGLTTDRAAVQKEIETQNIVRMQPLLTNPAARAAYLVDDASVADPPSVFMEPQRHAQAVAVHAARASVGVKILFDWLGSGAVPVDTPLAEARAQVCAICPKNKDGNFWQRIEASVARRLKQTIELKNSMNLRTSVDDKLLSCEPCDCWNPLKVHVPLQHVIKFDDAEKRKKFDEKCWIRAEAGDK